MSAKAPSENRDVVKIFVLFVFVAIVASSIVMAIERTKYVVGVTYKIGTYPVSPSLSGAVEWNGEMYKCLEGFRFFSDGLCRGNELVNGKSMTLAQSRRPCPPPAYRNSGERHCTHEPIRLEPIRVE